jgi:biopolymer transport protein ExbD
MLDAMRITSPLPHKKARIEIIPLIDIMFFLLASFMMASLAMIRLQSMEMNLPTSTISTSKKKPDVVDVNVKQNGDIYIDKVSFNIVDFSLLLSNRFRANTNVQVYIKGDDLATHGRVIEVLDLVRQQKIKNVSFALNSAPAKKR